MAGIGDFARGFSRLSSIDYKRPFRTGVQIKRTLQTYFKVYNTRGIVPYIADMVCKKFLSNEAEN